MTHRQETDEVEETPPLVAVTVMVPVGVFRWSAVTRAVALCPLESVPRVGETLSGPCGFACHVSEVVPLLVMVRVAVRPRTTQASVTFGAGGVVG